MVVLFFCGRFFAFQGAGEHQNAKRVHFSFGQYAESNGPCLVGQKYAAVLIDHDKMNQIGFDCSSSPPDATHLLSVADDPGNRFTDPHFWIKYYFDRTHPNAVFFHARSANEKQKKGYKQEFSNKRSGNQLTVAPPSKSVKFQSSQDEIQYWKSIAQQKTSSTKEVVAPSNIASVSPVMMTAPVPAPAVNPSATPSATMMIPAQHNMMMQTPAAPMIMQSAQLMMVPAQHPGMMMPAQQQVMMMPQQPMMMVAPQPTYQQPMMYGMNPMMMQQQPMAQPMMQVPQQQVHPMTGQPQQNAGMWAQHTFYRST